MDTPRNLGTAKRACEIAGCSPGTLRNWLKQGLISGVRVGPNGRFQYDLDDVRKMVIEYDATIEQRISEWVAAAPEPTPELISRIRLILHSASGPGDAP